ncbi:hypothetical protein AAG906_036950 [Vitis piasezkii]
MIDASSSPDRASVFCMCFPEEIPDYDLPMDLGDGFDGVILSDTYMDEMDMIGIGRILDTALRGPHSAFDMFGVSMIDSDDVTLYDACTDAMDMIGTGRILDASPPRPRSIFDVFGIFMLEFDGDGLVATDITHDTVSVEGASDSVDPPISFDTMFGFVTRFDDISDGNNDMSIFKYLPDRKVTPISGSTELIDFGALDQPRELRIGSSLSPDERSRLIDLLRSYLDVFAWSYEDMLGLDPTIVQHHLPILPHARPWLANVVLVPKKDGKVRVCVDFRDLNKASPKDDFPLPHIDMLVDNTWGIYCYRVMPFGLKNAEATYQRAATTLFHDMMYRDIEVYVDDMIVKSQDMVDHLATLQRFFERIRQFKLKLNPKKCTFGVTSGKLLGHIVNERGIEVDPKNIKVILDMPALRTRERLEAFLCLLSSPILVPPTPGRPLLLYLFISDMALGCMLAQLDDSGKEQTIYYLSKRMVEYECRYIMIERLYLALVWATRRLRHYMTEYSILLVSRLDPLRHLFDRPILTVSKSEHCCDHLASLPVSDDRPIDDDFPDEQFVSGDHIPRSVWLAFSDHHRLTNNIVEYEAFEELRYIHLPRAENQFADALATLASVIEIHAGVIVRPLLIETRSSDERGSCRSLWPTHGRTYVGPKDYEDRLFLVDYGGRLLPVRLEVPRVPDARGQGVQIHRSHIICRYEVPRELISDRGVHFRGDVDTLIQEYNIQHHRLSAYRPQTNGTVEAANKNIKRILRKMVKTSRDWSEKLPFALWAYRTSFRTSGLPRIL